MPLDPNNIDNLGPSEYSHGAGMFPPGIAANEGQKTKQDDFGVSVGLPSREGDIDDNYARMVAMKRTDTTDPNSDIDFASLGNPDRYGPGPALIQEEPQPNRRTDRLAEIPELVRRDDVG